MEYTARQIAAILNGELEGNPDVTVNHLSKIEEGKTHSISFLSNEKYTEYIYTTNASVVIVNKTLKLEKPLKPSCTLIRTEDARIAFSKLLEAYQKALSNKTGIENQAYLSPTAQTGTNIYIGAFSYIGEKVIIGNNVKIYPGCHVGEGTIIGDNTILHPNVKIYHDCVIGSGCVFHSGVVIGSDGFGFAPNSENNYQKVIHTGNVIIEDFVEVGANTTIDRATLGSTIIKKGVKLDNLIQIAHNVEIGENTVIAAQTGIAGSAKIGKNCMIGGQVGIVGHITIADGVKIAAQSGIGQSIKEENTIMQGSPAFSIGDYKRSYVMFKNLPKLKSVIDQLEKELAELKQISGQI
jgi:UDP-3-O-[3-hydroxymyristoyl] glucosamine N-acyltransferase